MKRQVIIIGSGIGGLTLAYLLTKQGDHVTILEHDKHPGGCLQSFIRDGIRFDTGFHFIGGMAEGGPLNRFFHDLDLLDLPWKELHEQEIWLGDECFVIPTGPEKWYQYMSNKFPHQASNLKEFLRVCREIIECPFKETMPYWEKNAWEWLCETIDDPKLRDVLSGSSLIVELNRTTLPLFAFAEIVYSYIYSAHRMINGGQPIIDHLLQTITAAGSEVLSSSTVTSILEEDGHVTGVQVQDGRQFHADIVVSAIHPIATMNLLSEQSAMRKIYRRRLSNLKDSMGCFTANLKLRKDAIIPRDRPIYVHLKDSDFWCYDAPPVTHLLVHFYPDQDAMDFIVPMSWKQVEKWCGTSVGNRGAEYDQFKSDVLGQCIELAEIAVPGLRDSIEKAWTSTPLTWHDYFFAHNGTAYGVCKDCNSPETTLLLPKTPLPGLYLAGQSIILHGIMGTTISSFIAAEFLKH